MAKCRHKTQTQVMSTNQMKVEREINMILYNNNNYTLASVTIASVIIVAVGKTTIIIAKEVYRFNFPLQSADLIDQVESITIVY